jgi:hypothetical protein
LVARITALPLHALVVQSDLFRSFDPTAQHDVEVAHEMSYKPVATPEGTVWATQGSDDEPATTTVCDEPPLLGLLEPPEARTMETATTSSTTAPTAIISKVRGCLGRDGWLGAEPAGNPVAGGAAAGGTGGGVAAYTPGSALYAAGGATGATIGAGANGGAGAGAGGGNVVSG